MITTINNKHNKLNFSSEREQSQACLNSAEHEKNQGRKVLNVPNLRFPEFQGEWEKCKFKDVCSTSTGNKNTQDKADDGIYPFYVRSQTVERINSWTFDGEAILTAGDGVGVGKVFHHSYGKIGVHQRVYILSDFKCDANYLFHFFSSKFYNRVKRMSAKNSVDSVRKEMITDMPLSLPCHQEQFKIGHILSLLDERIATQNKIIDKLQSLIRGIRNDVFGKFRKSVGVNAMVGEVLSYEQPQPYIVEDTEYTAEGIPVLTANKAFVLGYTSETDGIYDKGDCIIFDDFTLDCKYVDFPFKVKSSAIKILTAKDKELLRYTFEFMKYLDLSTDEHKRHYIAETQNQELFLPTAQVVRTIAHAFSALSSRMKTVTKQRDLFELQKQYLLRQMFI